MTNVESMPDGDAADGVIDLDGPAWVVREALGDTWQWFLDKPGVGLNSTVDAARSAAATPGWWPATVPGSVVTDLARAGELPDPYRDRNTRAAEWTGNRSWLYRRTVDLPDVAPGRRVVVELDGIDPSGSLWWDGERLGVVDGLYHRLRAAVPEHLATPGPHRVAVVVDPLPASEPQVGRTERVRVHRPRVTEGWDFCPRFPHQGIWRSARVVVGRVHLAAVSVRTEPAGGDDWVVSVDGTLEVTDDAPAELDLDCVDGAGDPVATATVQIAGPAGRRALRAGLVVPRPRLWWPRGLGEPATYTVRLRSGGRVLWRGTVGFRTAVLEPNAGAPAGALPYTGVVNGRRVPLVGWNWAPAEAQYGATPAGKVEHLVDLAARSGARLLRVWGGGLLETEEFYDACARAGILVWQEFSQSSSGIQSAPAADEAFVAIMRREAAAVVPARTHHPSLLVWDGGNELDDGAPLDERRSPVLAALRDEVARLDPGRAWLPTSPSGPVALHRPDPAAPGHQHDVHGPWEHQGLAEQQALADAATCLAHSEFGVEGMANRRLFEHLVPAPLRWPADRSNAVYRHLGEWWDNEPHVQACFGGRLGDVDTLREASQHLQASGLAYAVEADRRRWPRCSLVLPWQLAESYPNAWCTAVVDHLGDPKPAYHAVARAFAPNRVTLRVATTAWGGRDEAAAELWLWSEAGVAAGSLLVARLRDAEGAVLAERRWQVPGAVGEPRAVGELRCPLASLPADAVVLWEAQWLDPSGRCVDREVLVASTGADLSPLLDLAPARLDVRMHRQANASSSVRVVVRHLAGPAALGLRLLDGRPVGTPGWLVADGDPRPLLPGETRVLSASWRGGPVGPLAVAAWNAETHSDLTTPTAHDD